MNAVQNLRIANQKGLFDHIYEDELVPKLSTKDDSSEKAKSFHRVRDMS